MSVKIFDIIYHPSPVLRQKAKEISEKKIRTKAMQKFIIDMEATMLEKDGAGLAAPQVGISERLIVIAQKNKKNLVMINPIITRKSWKKAIDNEGCLSVIDEKGEIIYGKVERHKDISCQYFDAQGKKKKIKADDYLARVIQHEIDHLDGILFIDRLID
jgi:peptide deformylase